MAGDTKNFQTQFRIGAVWAGQRGVQQAQRALGGPREPPRRRTTHVRGMTACVFKGMAAYGLASKAVAGFTNVLFKTFPRQRRRKRRTMSSASPSSEWRNITKALTAKALRRFPPLLRKARKPSLRPASKWSKRAMMPKRCKRDGQSSRQPALSTRSKSSSKATRFRTCFPTSTARTPPRRKARRSASVGGCDPARQPRAP